MMAMAAGATGSLSAVALLLVVLQASVLPSARAAAAYRHTWGTVADVMGMHGQGAPDAASAAAGPVLEFAADHYAMITTAAPCQPGGAVTIEDGTLAVAARIKAANPAALVGMYWRTDFVGEIAMCSNFTAELKAHGEEYYLRDDDGSEPSYPQFKAMQDAGGG